MKKSNSLAEIIAAINEKYGTNFTEMDKVLEQIQQDFLADERLVSFAQNNDEAMFGLKFEQEFENFAAKRYEENDAFFVKMFTDSGVMKSIVDMLKPIIYRKMRRKNKEQTTKESFFLNLGQNYTVIVNIYLVLIITDQYDIIKTYRINKGGYIMPIEVIVDDRELINEEKDSNEEEK